MAQPTSKPVDDDAASLLDAPAEEEGFVDERLQEKLDQRDPKTEAFFRLLAICHTVRVEVVDGVPEFQAQSPDEKALVEGAR
jgi:magnesium-transporting ATPase (P-type)